MSATARTTSPTRGARQDEDEAVERGSRADARVSEPQEVVIRADGNPAKLHSLRQLLLVRGTE